MRRLGEHGGGSPATVFGDPEVVEVKSGSGSSLGITSSTFHAPEAECTVENLAAWYGEYVADSDDNWCVVVYSDDPSRGVAAYAGMVEVGVGLEEDDDGSYYVADSSGSTLYSYDSEKGELTVIE